jgi:hypothetical protein
MRLIEPECPRWSGASNIGCVDFYLYLFQHDPQPRARENSRLVNGKTTVSA